MKKKNRKLNIEKKNRKEKQKNIMEKQNDSDRIAIVTGASSGIGQAISQALCLGGYEVYGIGRDFRTLGNSPGFENMIDRESVRQVDDINTNESWIHKFHPVVCDLLDTNRLKEVIDKITDGHRCSLLVNNAGVAYYGLHEELNTEKIQLMVRTNLEVPMVLTQLLLRQLKENQGMIINISSVTAHKSSPHGCAYAATKAGLSSFSQSLFDEARKYGVRVVSIHPDMTATRLYRNADFREDDKEDARLLPEDVAKAVTQVISFRDGINITELTIQPQKHRIRKK